MYIFLLIAAVKRINAGFGTTINLTCSHNTGLLKIHTALHLPFAINDPLADTATAFNKVKQRMAYFQLLVQILIESKGAIDSAFELTIIKKVNCCYGTSMNSIRNENQYTTKQGSKEYPGGAITLLRGPSVWVLPGG